MSVPLQDSMYVPPKTAMEKFKSTHLLNLNTGMQLLLVGQIQSLY
jgi:hypothetical protein